MGEIYKICHKQDYFGPHFSAILMIQGHIKLTYHSYITMDNIDQNTQNMYLTESSQLKYSPTTMAHQSSNDRTRDLMQGKLFLCERSIRW